MFARMRLIGSGTRDDPYRVPIPFGQILLGNTTAGTLPMNLGQVRGFPSLVISVPSLVALVSLPDDDLSTLVMADPATTLAQIGTQLVVTHVAPELVAQIKATYAQRYAERAGEFDVQVA